MYRYTVTIHGQRGGDFTVEVAADTDGEAFNKAEDKASAVYPYRFTMSILCKDSRPAIGQLYG